MVPSPSVDHQDIVGRLYRQISDYLDRHGGGRVFVAPLDVVLADHDVVQPDLIFVSDDDAPAITAKNVWGVPTWIVEVVSDPVRDLKTKRDKYKDHGVPEYWAVDPELRRAEIFRPDVQRQIVEHEASPTVLPKLSIDLAAVFGTDKRPRRL